MARRRLITRTEVARLAGVSLPSISRACNHGKLRPACVREKADLDHPAIATYLARHGAVAPPTAQAQPKATKRTTRLAGGRPKGPASPPQPANPAPTVDPDGPRMPVGIDLPAEPYASMTLDHVAREYATMAELERVVDIVKSLRAIRAADDKHFREEGSVIPREFVDAHIMGAFERCLRNLLGPLRKTMMRRAWADAIAGKPVADGEKMAADLIGAEIKSLKTAIAKALRSA